MKRLPKTHPLRRTASRVSPLLMLLQRSPVIQWLIPEAKILGNAGIGEITKWTVATVAGLGAYDSVSGATEITQISPQPGSTTINTAVGARLTFVYQVTGATITTDEESWEIAGDLPPGVSQDPRPEIRTDSILGVPTEIGEYPIVITAWRYPNFVGDSTSQPFLISVGPAVITNHPASVTIASGTTTTLTVGAEGTGISYQWYKGTVPNSTTLIAGATGSSYTTPQLTTSSTYIVRVVRGTIISFSNPATVTIGTPAPFQDWRSAQFNTTQLADPNISGPDADPDGDSFTNTTEYVFGTLPLTSDPSTISMTTPGTDVSLFFTAKSAAGAGYAGKTRHYALETRTDLVSGGWTSPIGFSDITGSNQAVTYTTARSAVPTFYRLRVWLTP